MVFTQLAAGVAEAQRQVVDAGEGARPSEILEDLTNVIELE